MNTVRYRYVEFTLTIGTWELIDAAYFDTGFEGGLIIPSGVGREIIAAPAPTTFRMPDEALIEAPSWTGRLMLNGWETIFEAAAIGKRYLLSREVIDQIE